MGFLSDEFVRIHLDEILSGMKDSSRKLMAQLLRLNFIPRGELPTIIFGIFLFIEYYNRARENSTIDESFEMAKSKLFQNQIIQKYLADKTAQSIDHAAGVN